MKYALINKSGEVLNVIVWDGIAEYQIDPSQALIAVKPTTAVDTTYSYVNGEFVKTETIKKVSELDASDSITPFSKKFFFWKK